MQYKLIVVDMDGTLLNSQKEVSERNKKAVKEALNSGVNVAIATGRIYTSARFYAKLLGIYTPIIACNGALIRDFRNNRPIYCNSIKQEDSINIAQICKKHNVYFHFYDDERFFVEKLGYTSLKYYQCDEKNAEEDQIHFVKIENTVDYLEKNDIEILKFVIIDDNMEKLKNVKKELQEINTLEISKSWYNNIEVMTKGVSKGKAVGKLREIYQLKREEIIAFGDNYNDLSMKDYVGTFVAMGNGEEIVKQQAGFITTSNDEDGVAIGIEKLVLNRGI